MGNKVLKNSINSQFEWKRNYRTKSLPFANKIPFIRELIINNIPKSMLKKVYIFGSYAYGRPTKNSDIDICIVVKDNIDIDSIYKMIHMPFCDNNILKIDVLIYEEKIFNNRFNPEGIEAIIDKKGILLYG